VPRTPLVCRLDALMPQERRRHAELTGELASTLRRIEELPRGWAFSFPGGASVAPRLVEWMSFERRCCPFLEFELDFGEGDEAAILRLTGTAEVKKFLAHEIAPFFLSARGPRPSLPSARRPARPD
jgi:hypothetical protein